LYLLGVFLVQIVFQRFDDSVKTAFLRFILRGPFLNALVSKVYRK
jgi:hypothetical protein